MIFRNRDILPQKEVIMKKKNTYDTNHQKLPDIDIIDLDELSEEGVNTAIQNAKNNNFQQTEITDTESDEGWAEEYSSQDNSSQDNSSQNKPFWARINWHIVFGVVVVLILGLIILRFKNFGTFVDLDQIEGNQDLEVYDSILPVLPKDGVVAEGVDDGVTTILAFGNSPFADDRASDNSLASLIEQKSGAKVYNCAVEGTHLACGDYMIDFENNPIDAFNFYWLSALMCMDSPAMRENYTKAFAFYENQGIAAPSGAQETYDTLTTIDYNTVDVITIMYDGADYLDGRGMFNDAEGGRTDIMTFTGNMEAGIELIQQTYPHIRIIVMSPTYAYGLEDDGSYISSDLKRYGQDVLSTYVIRQCYSAYTREVSFVDNLYGTINENNASEYLTDHIHLNEKGRELVADRFIYALTYYDD